MIVKEFAEKYAGCLIHAPEVGESGIVLGYSGELLLILMQDHTLGWPLSSLKSGKATITFEVDPQVLAEYHLTRAWWGIAKEEFLGSTLPMKFGRVLYAPSAVNLTHYPHKCPKCMGPAYVGVVPNSVDCSKGCR